MIKYHEITDFTNTHLETLKNVLSVTLAEYFTSFELSEDKDTLTCYDGNDPLLVFSQKSGSAGIQKVTLNGNNVSASNSVTTSGCPFCSRVAVTSCGAGLRFAAANGDNKGYAIYITKTKGGKTAVFALFNTFYSNAANHRVHCMTSESANKNTVSVIAQDFGVAKPLTPDDHDLTELAHVLVSGTSDYCPNLFCMVNSQFYGTEGKLDIDGVKYLSNGYYLLKDE